jgi:hypothetical protein
MGQILPKLGAEGAYRASVHPGWEGQKSATTRPVQCRKHSLFDHPVGEHE